MSQKWKIYSGFVLVLLLLISPFMIPTQGDLGEEEIGSRANGDYANFDEWGLGTHYIGETVDFRIYVYNRYEGQHWIGDEYNYNHDYLYDTKLQILPNDVRMSDGTPASGTILATTPTSLTPYNGELSEGFTITSQRTYYSSDDNDNFEFKISTMNVQQGYYELPLKITARVQVDFSSTDPSGYSWQTIQDYGYVTFYVRSNIMGLNTENSLSPYESGYVPLYAGSTYMTLRGPNIGPQVIGISDLDLDLSLPSDYFNVQVPTFHIDTFTGYYYPTWKVEVYDDTPPKLYTGKIVCTYSRGGENYIEGPYNATVTVANTPLLLPPDTMDMTEPTLVTTQKTESLSFAFQMINGGNVDLESVTVRLDLDSASFLSQLEYYYDEDDHASKVYAPLEYTTDDVGIGQVINVVFPTVSVYGMLPPGDYMIPIDYKVSYKDPSMDPMTATRLDSYQWDELYQNDYINTMYYLEDPRPTDLKKPHFMMRVLDDADGADIKVECDQIFRSGSKNIPVQFDILNKEFYSIRNAKIDVRSSDDTMVWSSVSPGDTALLATREDVTIPSSYFGNPGSVQISGMIDVSGECPTGAFDIELTITGNDEVGKAIQINSTSTMKIKAEPGQLTVASIATGSVEPGKKFTMEVNLINSGDVAISDFQVMLQCTDNMITVESPYATGTIVEPGATVTVEFECKAAKSMDYEMASQMTLATKINDDEGNKKDFTDDNGLNVNIMAAREPDDLATQSAIRAVGVYFLLAILIATILFCIALIISVMLVIFRDRIAGPKEKNEKKEAVKEEKKEEKDDSFDKLLKEQESVPPPTTPPTQKVAPAPAPQQIQQAPVQQQPQAAPAPQQAQQPQPQAAPAQQEPLPGKSGLDDIFG